MNSNDDLYCTTCGQLLGIKTDEHGNEFLICCPALLAEKTGHTILITETPGKKSRIHSHARPFLFQEVAHKLCNKGRRLNSFPWATTVSAYLLGFTI
jgi:hypothetical protein